MRDDGGDRVTHEADLLGGERHANAFVVDDHEPFVGRQLEVARGVDGDDSRHCDRGFDVDVADARVRDRRAHEDELECAV